MLKIYSICTINIAHIEQRCAYITNHNNEEREKKNEKSIGGETNVTRFEERNTPKIKFSIPQ